MKDKEQLEPDDKEQYDRFVKAAERTRERGSEERFDDAMKCILWRKENIRDKGGKKNERDRMKK